jgi:hypothetical protein
MSRELIETGLGWRPTPLCMAALITDAETVALVVCDASRIHGFAAMQFGDDHAHLVLMCVQPDHRRCGTGRCLHEWRVE